MIKRALGKIILASALTIGSAVYHVFDPTLLPRLWYTLKDPFVTTKTEKKIEKEYSIDYEGTDNEVIQRAVQENLRRIKKANPELLKHCAKIVMHPHNVINSPAIKPFIYFRGRAFYTGMIELTTIELPTIIHELTHTKHFEEQNEFEEKLDKIFGGTYSQELEEPTYWYWIKKISPTVWQDGTFEPRNGFVRPYGANNSKENVATYVEEAYNQLFWEKPELQKDEKYAKTLALLLEYKFITKQQYKDILKTIQTNNPEWVKNKLETSLQDLEPPKLIEEKQTTHFKEEIYFRNKDINIYCVFTLHGDDSIWIDLKIDEETKQFRINKSEGKLIAKHPNEELLPQTILEKLAQHKYDKLFDYETYTAIIHPERK